MFFRLLRFNQHIINDTVGKHARLTNLIMDNEHIIKLNESRRKKEGWPCKDCDRVFLTFNLLLLHRREDHNIHRPSLEKRSWECKYCKNIFSSRRKLYAHYKECSKKAELASTIGYDSLGRIKNVEGYKKAAETLKKRYANGEIEHKHILHTEDEKKHLSEVRIAYLETHNDYGLKWYIVNGIKVQGTWEKKFAEYLVSKNIKFERNRIPFARNHTYTPDFYCPEYDVYFEVKGFRRDRDIYKMYLVLDEHPNLHIKMIEREQLENLEKINIFELRDFQEIYKRENIDMSKFKNIWN